MRKGKKVTPFSVSTDKGSESPKGVSILYPLDTFGPFCPFIKKAQPFNIY